MKKVIYSICLALLTAVFFTQTAAAHASLIRSDPADGAQLAVSPHSVTLWFDEAISHRFSSIQLYDSRTQSISVTNIQSNPDDPKQLTFNVPELSAGVYSVLWKVLSESDGHISQGLLVFGVGTEVTRTTASIPTERPASPEVGLRWLNFTLLAGLVGALAVLQLVLVPLQQSERTTRIVSQARRRIISWVQWCGLLAFAVGGGLLLWQTVLLQGTLPERISLGEAAWQIVRHTRWGVLWTIRQSLLILLTAALIMMKRAVRIQRMLGWIVGITAVSLLFVQTLSGHASAVTPFTELSLVVDLLHLLAASMWVGGLLALAVGLLPLMRQDHATFYLLIKAGWKPFGKVAVVSVGLLLATGLYNTGRQVASPDALITTLYGQSLLVKISLMVAAGAVGLINSMLLHPRVAAPLAALLRRPSGWTPLSLRQLPKLVMLELSLGLIVLLLTGLITAAPAPRGVAYTVDPQDVPEALTDTVDDMVITLLAKPNRPGQNVFTVFAASSRRPVPAEITRVLLRFTYLEQDVGRVSIQAEEIAPGRFQVTGNQLSLAGSWQIDVVVRRDGLEDSVAQFNWIVAPPGELPSEMISKRPLQTPLTFAAAAFLALMIGTIAIIVWRSGSNSVQKISYTEKAYSQMNIIMDLETKPPPTNGKHAILVEVGDEHDG